MSKNTKIQATKNKAKDTETKPPVTKPPIVEPPAKPLVYELPEPLRQALLNYLMRSTPKVLSVEQVINLGMELQQLRKV